MCRKETFFSKSLKLCGRQRWQEKDGGSINSHLAGKKKKSNTGWFHGTVGGSSDSTERRRGLEDAALDRSEEGILQYLGEYLESVRSSRILNQDISFGFFHVSVSVFRCQTFFLSDPNAVNVVLELVPFVPSRSLIKFCSSFCPCPDTERSTVLRAGA